MDTCNLFPHKFGANECHCTKTILLGVFRKKNHSSSNNNKKLPQEKLQHRFYICAHKDFLIYWCVRVLWSSIWIAIDWNRLVKHLNNIAINGATFDSMMLVSVSRIWSRGVHDQEFQWKQREVFNGWSSCTRNQCINITRRTFYNWIPKKKNTRETKNKIHTISFAHWTFYATCVIKFMRTHWTQRKKQAPEQTDIINSIERKQETVKKDEEKFLRFKHTRTYTHICWLNRELFVHCLAASAYFNFYTLHNPLYLFSVSLVMTAAIRLPRI